jgi:hypothetical protein
VSSSQRSAAIEPTFRSTVAASRTNSIESTASPRTSSTRTSRWRAAGVMRKVAE